MAEKRFITNEVGCIVDLKDKHLRNYDGEEIVDLLNELNDECEFLKIENEALEHGATKYAELYHNSLKENEQLKSENEWLKSIRFANDVLKENKELKSFIKKLTSNDGKIWLMNGYVYKTDKILKGDVE